AGICTCSGANRFDPCVTPSVLTGCKSFYLSIDRFVCVKGRRIGHRRQSRISVKEDLRYIKRQSVVRVARYFTPTTSACIEFVEDEFITCRPTCKFVEGTSGKFIAESRRTCFTGGHVSR